MSVRAPVHFIGISGIGMSALARLLHQRGVAVQGSSDRATALTERLVAEGIPVFVGHRADNLGGAATVVFSSAIPAENAELAAARSAGLPILRRGALLAQLMRERDGLAVAGTHGKTTSAAMIAHILEQAGFAPAWIIGGLRIDGELNARDGGGTWLVAEADESDLSFLEMRPRAALITNVENDHVTSDGDFTEMCAAFARFAALVPAGGALCIGIDGPAGARLAANAHRGVVTFGSHDADFCYGAVETAGFRVEFDVRRAGAVLGRVSMPLVGELNARNATGAIALCMQIGVGFEQAAAALATFRGVRRRFDVLIRAARMTVVDDYAHHPTAIAATIEASRANADGSVVAVFQPHRYTRTKYLAGEFAEALAGADRVILTDIYAASEPAIAGVDARSIGEPLRRRGVAVDYVPDVRDLPQFLLAVAPAGATVLMLGAGSITDAAAALARAAGALPELSLRG